MGQVERDLDFSLGLGTLDGGLELEFCDGGDLSLTRGEKRDGF